ncbi:MAG: C4-dicarboxylate TRAP transporter large permease protein DctM [Alphaproteobacteria bacterium MarineAlpha3_Bin7]|nr:MAG: C4-dicarboxylate TRAP transporter large permease protein DctM [Alphaproteobacteria bacterium MarineAlpha3_Bin7]
MLEAPTVLLLMGIALIVFIVAGLHIYVVLGMVSLVGTYLLFGDVGITLELASSSAYAVLRNAVFAAIPLFVLMGEFMSRAGMATDLYKIANYFLRKLPGRLAIATVLGNAVFAAVTGVSVASAMTFSRIAYPEMMKFGYNRSFALGSIAGSASLGMLIPPSVLLIVWGIIIEKSIGKLFLAGFIPGLILALLMGIYVSARASMRPDLAPSKIKGDTESIATVPTGKEIISGLGVIVLILLVLGGLFAGFFTPMESAAVGCGGAIIFSYIKGLRWSQYRTAVVDSGKTIAPVLVLLMTAAMYAKFLALGSVVDMIQDIINGMGLGPFGVTVLMILIWLALGTLIDSISIILLTVPIFWPLAEAAGWDVNAFAIFGILAIEAGLLTPPLGLLVYTVKGAVPDPSVTLTEIFAGSIPYWILMLIVMTIIWIWPVTATFLTTFG